MENNRHMSPSMVMGDPYQNYNGYHPQQQVQFMDQRSVASSGSRSTRSRSSQRRTKKMKQEAIKRHFAEDNGASHMQYQEHQALSSSKQPYRNDDISVASKSAVSMASRRRRQKQPESILRR